MALSEGLVLAEDLGLRRGVITPVCFEVINSLKTKNLDRYSAIIEKIKDLESSSALSPAPLGEAIFLHKPGLTSSPAVIRRSPLPLHRPLWRREGGETPDLVCI
jgi:hypothetical protein